VKALLIAAMLLLAPQQLPMRFVASLLTPVGILLPEPLWMLNRCREVIRAL